ncbi:MAG: hypothetical protein GY861_13340, partial [bacterium]|nr:hypothetical protein [bacterium]
MNTYNNNIGLIAFLLIIATYVVVLAVKHNIVPRNIYPIIIFLIGISLLLMEPLRCSHIMGRDAHFEYDLFQQTLLNGQWQIFHDHDYEACLSVTILPTVYQSFLDMDSEYLFKLLDLVFFSLVPLTVFILCRRYIAEFYAFVAALFFITQERFVFAAGGFRTNIAIFFFALAILILFHDRISEFNRKVLFFVFASACIVSHYSTTYILLVILITTWIGTHAVKKCYSFTKKRYSLTSEVDTCTTKEFLRST